jgi:hypothetical protein
MDSLFQLATRHTSEVKFINEGRAMQNMHELNADIAELNKSLGLDKPVEWRVRGIMEQLGDNSLLAIGTVAPPIRQDEETSNQLGKDKKPN